MGRDAAMRIGAVFPQGGAVLDRGAIRAFAEAASDLGYRHLSAFDHVLGADPEQHPGYAFPLTHANPYREVFVLFAYISACAPELELCTSVLVLPQRQTSLVAKQAADVDMLTDGRLRIGVGTGWNRAEYQALGVPWAARGRRLDEQIELLRSLWTQHLVTTSGGFHEVVAAGINPLPIQRPIPIWIGGSSDRALRRAALLGDGYIPPRPLPLDPFASEWPGRFQRIFEMRRSDGRQGGTYGIEVRPEPDDPDDWEATARAWQRAGATHLSVTVTIRPDATIDEHITQLETARAALSSFFEVGEADQMDRGS